MAGGGDASSELEVMPFWAFALLVVLLVLTMETLRRFGFEEYLGHGNRGADNLDKFLENVITVLLAIGLASLLFKYGDNYIHAAIGISGMALNLYHWCAATVVTCGCKMARQRLKVIYPPDFTSEPSFQLEVRALRMIRAAPLVREALREEMSRLLIESEMT